LDVEELGSVYESLLDFHPQVNLSQGKYEFLLVSGSDRKTTGSYYTPRELVGQLVKSVLEPVISEKLNGSDDPQKALLSIKVCDPACGSGHFLLAAARRIGTELARLRTKEVSPNVSDLRKAIRDVIRHCIYGVDANPMAVDLCKVALWIDGFNTGLPLNFLDHHIQCGNSLIGATPFLLEQGILTEAFTFVEGDEKAYCAKYKKKNQEEHKGQMSLLSHDLQPWERLGNLAASMMELREVSDETIEGVKQKQELYTEYVRSSNYLFSQFWADAWCAAFVWQKTNKFPYPITEEVFRQIEHNPYNAPSWLRDEVKNLAEKYQFFHWHLAFPDVFNVSTGKQSPENIQTGWNGGFDAIIGNPPWEKINLEDEEFFAVSYPEIAKASNKAKRKKMIDALQVKDPQIYNDYIIAQDFHDRLSLLFRNSGLYPLTGVSRINLYSVFAELNVRNLAPCGRTGLVIASGIVTDDNNKEFFEYLISNQQLVSVYDFENREGIFPSVDSRYKFSLFSASGRLTKTKAPNFGFYLTRIEHIGQEDRIFSLTPDEFLAINPNTKTCPTFRNKREAEITKSIYKKIKAWCLHDDNPTYRGIPRTPFNMSNDSDFFFTKEEMLSNGATLNSHQHFELDSDVYLPVYESKLIHQFNHRYSTFAGLSDSAIKSGNSVEISASDLENPSLLVEPRYWMKSSILRERFKGKYFLVYRMITNATNERASIASVIANYACGNSLTVIDEINVINSIITSINMNSFIYDYIARQKIAGVNFNHWIWKQLPLPTLEQVTVIGQIFGQPDSLNWLITRFLELTYTSIDLQPFAQDCDYDGIPFKWDEQRRFLIRCELDAAWFYLYGIQRQDIEYIMETFPLVKRKDEKQYQDYRTKNKILEIYDAIQEAINLSTPYQTILDPPPADPRVAHSLTSPARHFES